MSDGKAEKLPRKQYEKDLLRLQTELVRLQEWVRAAGARLVVIFEGRDAAGRCSTYRWKYHWVRSRSVGLGRAAIRATRGLRCSVTRLMVPPLPAASRPSKITTSRAPAARTHS